jgi:ubiquinone/menaquinone biosynthesis C-methylase UbiE
MFHTLPMTDRPRLPVRLFYRLSYHVTDSRIYKKMWKYWYPVVTRGLSADDVVFINWAYEEDPPMAIPLTASDEPNRGHIQLYHRTATQADLGGKRVLEISCGHGGGASYLTRTLHPASYTGLDLNPEGIAFCQKRHDVPGLDFVQGDAENLPFDDQSFDVLLNVEASHCYPRFSRFLAEVTRVLRPGRYFLYCDLRPSVRVAEWEADLANAPMRQLSQRVINAEVLRGLEKNSERSQNLVNRNMPAFLRIVGREFAGVNGSSLHQGLQNGDVSYRMYCFTKD